MSFVTGCADCRRRHLGVAWVTLLFGSGVKERLGTAVSRLSHIVSEAGIQSRAVHLFGHLTTILVAALTAALLVPGACQQAERARAPVIPGSMAAQERELLLQARSLLARGEHDQAARLVGSLALGTRTRVFVDWTPVGRASRETYRRAVQLGFDSWNRALGEVHQFARVDKEEEADLVILFESTVAAGPRAPQPSPEPIVGFARPGTGYASAPRPICVEMNLDRDPAAGGPLDRRTGTIHVSLSVPGAQIPHSPAAITHLIGNGFGTWLGLASTQDTADLMGPDTHTDSAVMDPTALEGAQVSVIQQVRLALLRLARSHAPVIVPNPVMAAVKTSLDAGDVWRGEGAKYVFTLKNTGDAPLEITATPNCGCTVSSYEHTIRPGGEGKIDAEIRTDSFMGRIVKLIEVTSNDPDRPKLSLQMAANILNLVQVLPNDRPVMLLKEEGPTAEELTVRVHNREPVEITQVTSGSAFVSATVEPIADADGDRRYRLLVSVHPEAPWGRSTCRMMLITNSGRLPRADITLTLEKGICAAPASVFMGLLTPATVVPVTQLVTVTRRAGAFHVTKASTDDANLDVKVSGPKEGQEYRLLVSYKGGWPAGIVQRRVTIDTDDPRQSRIEIPVIANVVAAGPTRR